MALSLGHLASTLGFGGAGYLQGRENRQRYEDELARQARYDALRQAMFAQQQGQNRWSRERAERLDAERNAERAREQEQETATVAAQAAAARELYPDLADVPDREAIAKAQARIAAEQRDKPNPSEAAYAAQQVRLEREGRRGEQAADVRGRARKLLERGGPESVVSEAFTGLAPDLKPGEYEQIIQEVLGEWRARPRQYKIISPNYQGEQAVGQIIELTPEQAQAATGMVQEVPRTPQAAPRPRQAPRPQIPTFDTIEQALNRPAPSARPEVPPLLVALQRERLFPSGSDYGPR